MSTELPSPERKITVPITAQTRADFEEKVKAALKAEYKAGDVVDIQKFSDEHQVRTGNVRKIVEALDKEGYPLKLPAVVKMPIKSEQR
jgi:uncharacterized protein YcgL (UPF0745 family)